MMVGNEFNLMADFFVCAWQSYGRFSVDLEKNVVPRSPDRARNYR